MVADEICKNLENRLEKFRKESGSRSEVHVRPRIIRSLSILHPHECLDTRRVNEWRYCTTLSPHDTDASLLQRTHVHECVAESANICSRIRLHGTA